MRLFLSAAFLAAVVVGACAGGSSPPQSPTPSSPSSPDSGSSSAETAAPSPSASISASSSVAPSDVPRSDAGTGGGGLLVFDPQPSQGRRLRVFDLGAAACNPAPVLRRLQPASKCSVIKAKAARASSAGYGKDAEAARAFDGDACTVWNSGGHPAQAIEAELERPEVIAAMVFVPEMTPERAKVLHGIELRAGDGAPRKLAIETTLASNTGYLVLTGESAPSDRVRIVTTTSPSWVAWREIMFIRCDGTPNVIPGVHEVVPVPSPVNPDAPMPPRIVMGQGACKVASDCAPQFCCGPRTCVSKDRAPRCDGIGCGQGCGGDTMDCARGTCACEKGTCAAAYKPR